MQTDVIHIFYLNKKLRKIEQFKRSIGHPNILSNLPLMWFYKTPDIINIQSLTFDTFTQLNINAINN